MSYWVWHSADRQSFAGELRPRQARLTKSSVETRGDIVMRKRCTEVLENARIYLGQLVYVWLGSEVCGVIDFMKCNNASRSHLRLERP